MPRPNKGESEQNFVNRCVVDPEAMRDFPNVGQRLAFCYSQYERYKKPINKNFVESWQRAYEDQRDKAEAKNIASVRRFYNQEYAKGISQFVENNNIQLIGLFKEDDLNKLYQQVYVNTGLHFANWYARNFDKLATKGINPSQYKNVWQTNFAKYAASVAATNVSLVQETARKTLIQVTTKILRDPDFMLLGAREQARILRSQFDGYSKYQAERFIRTETTRISNLAVRDAATTVYGKDQLLKRWSVRLDGRERLAHREMAGKDPIPFEEDFIVGGDPMAEPGDGSRTSAKNVVNCRCSVVYIPREEAETTGFTDIGFGLGGQEIPRSTTIQEIAAGLATTIAKPKPKPTVNTLEDVIQSNKNVPPNIIELFDDKDNLNIELFTHFTAGPQRLRIKNIRAEHRTGEVTMGKIKNLHERKQTYIHESGHFVADSRKWIIKGLIEKDKAVLPLEKIFNKWSKYALDKKNTRKLYFELEELKPFETFETLGKKLGYTSVSEYRQDIGALKDVFGALTKERIGGGHGKAYYNKKNSQWHEFIAHAYENKFLGNKVFKNLYPKLYNDMINLVDELHANY